VLDSTRSPHTMNTSSEQKVTVQDIKNSVSTFAPVNGVPEVLNTKYRVCTERSQCAKNLGLVHP